jgi:hypothetical protein
MRETEGVSASPSSRPGITSSAPGAGRKLVKVLGAAILALATVAVMSGCTDTGAPPNSATSATPAPGSFPTLGVANQGDLKLSSVSIVRKGTRLIISATISNSGATADALLSIGSQVSPTLTLTPPVPVPAHGSVTLGGSGASAVLDQQGRLEPGGTVDLMLDFRDAGQFQVFSTFEQVG